MLIAFQCYDVDGDQQISSEEVKAVLRNIPSLSEEKHGRGMTIGRGWTMKEQLQEMNHDDSQIDRLVEIVFSFHQNGMYFDEFCQTAKHVTSEFFLSIYDCIYNDVPCAKNFLILRSNFRQLITQNLPPSLSLTPKSTDLKPPITDKIRKKFYCGGHANGTYTPLRQSVAPLEDQHSHGKNHAQNNKAVLSHWDTSSSQDMSETVCAGGIHKQFTSKMD